jgi:hypothetical protein
MSSPHLVEPDFTVDSESCDVDEVVLHAAHKEYAQVQTSAGLVGCSS